MNNWNTRAIYWISKSENAIRLQYKYLLHFINSLKLFFVFAANSPPYLLQNSE